MIRHLLIFGFGYTGHAIGLAAQAAGFDVTATSRDPGRVEPAYGIRLVGFDAAEPVIARATHILTTAAPGDAGDPVLARYAGAIAGAQAAWFGYLSTTGVYGNRDGAWVDEDSEPAPGSDRTRRRVEAEAAWRAAADGKQLDIFRIAGIYGPGRSVFDDLRAGTARHVIKPDHLFGRIHRDDIAGAVLAAIEQPATAGTRILNLADDEPAASADVLLEAARLLGAAPPPPVEFDTAWAGMSPMARSFWAENRRVANAKTKAALNLSWRYPTYREGLAAIHQEAAGSA